MRLRHPPLKAAFFFVSAFLGALLGRLESILVSDVYGLILLAAAAVPPAHVWQRLRYALWIVLLMFLFFPLIAPTPGAGLVQAARYGGRLLFIGFMLAFLFHELPLDHFFRALQALRVPGVIVWLLRFTVRFGELAKIEAARMRMALRARGYRERSFFSLSAYRALSRLLGALLLRTLARSERVTVALRARGFTGDERLPPFPPGPPGERWIAALWLLPLLLLLGWEGLVR
ncbi:energy-coupling factor transporter transmembrane component T [Hydrogenibacillus schlegelii]|uniref:Energy-coupling factor transporter transmembrane protein EcfT n=1 Tax=Hydrogenibacillus schlegelii TaxID=1484 RepID=A0A179IU64_HYDSH|nr:energy-coupling factor transporter transmembrane component T [Hydrogenibacillus schlegelii]MBT9282926.1 energy-coupling factor transporter transmembrane protein EcfT [Hydrogenibacillus schlegelii]MBT9283245.1 energy-coupling factor transporter transmembrane protein EcfT [Hydrogenibacillus schlegelii]OAR05482.1 hypothetical protein SA87_11370 [Hydrogenibacillus schlegelii]PTQ54077.1 MAG: Transmembrane component NikQ of energizing module of nickel ECF transporter [Hydrogenibacillus schlegelii]